MIAYLHVSLNCLMMFATFSQVIRSSFPLSWWWLRIRKVDRSNSTASLQREISQRVLSVDWMNLWLGMRSCTICDHAWQSVSSQMLVAKYFLILTFSFSATSWISRIFFSIFFSRSSKGTLSILWISTKMFAFSLYCLMLFSVSSQYSKLFFSRSPWSSISNTQISTSTPRKMVSFCTRKYCSMNVSCPPQSQRFSVSVPMNLNLCSCRSTVYPIFCVSLAGKLAKMTECMDVLPAPEQPIKSIFFIAQLDIHNYYHPPVQPIRLPNIKEIDPSPILLHDQKMLILNHSWVLQFKSMENFQLREGSSRRNNAFRNLSNNTCRSFISTALGGEGSTGDELRKSRIQNLPNYKKSSLGDNINFIVVFQTIEIERLSREVELLRMKIRENERELFNAQNYEIQIRELTEKCFHFEQEKELYTQEIEKLNKIAENLYNESENHKQSLEEMAFAYEQKEAAYMQKNQELQQEIDRWRNRSQVIERNKSKDMEELKSLMEHQRKSIVDRDMKEMSIRHQNEKSALENQVRKCKEWLSNKNNQLDDLKNKNGKLQSKVDSLGQARQSAADYEAKIVFLTTEVARVNDIVKARDQEIQTSRKREAALSSKVKEQSQLESECKYLKGIVQNRAKELEDAKSRCNSYEEQALRCKEMVHFINELQDKLTFSTNEINRVSGLLKGKVEENEKIKAKFMERENEFSRLKNIENEVAQSESKFNMMRAENDRINSILKTRLEEIDNWKKRYNDLDSVSTRCSLLERDKRTLEQKYSNQLKEGEQLKFTITKLETENGQLRKTQKSYGQQVSKNNLLSKQLDRLNSIIKDNLENLTTSKLRYSKMQESLRNYQDKLEYIKDYENRIRLLQEENKRLNSLIENKNEDIESLESSKIDLVTKINHYKNYEVKVNEYESVIKKLSDNIEAAKRDLDVYQNKCRGYENKIREMENNVNYTQQEKERLNGLNKNKSNEIEEYKNRLSKLEQEYRRMQEVDKVCQGLHMQIQEHIREIQAIEKKEKEYEDAYNREKKLNEDFARKIATMTRDLDSLNKELNSRSSLKSKEIDSLEDKVKTHLQRVKEKDQEIQKLLGKIDKLERECEKIKNDFNKIAAVVENNERETLALNQKIEQYKDYAKRIHILSAELDRLTSLNRSLEEDNKKMRLKYADNIEIEKREQSIALMVVLMSAEIESLRAQVDKREVKLDEMRKSILEPLKRV